MHWLASLLLWAPLSTYMCRHVHLKTSGFIPVHNWRLWKSKRINVRKNVCTGKSCKKKTPHIFVGKEIIIGTRDSPLAIKQSEKVRTKLEAYFKKVNKNVKITLKSIKTMGDNILDQKVDLFGGKGIFTKELDEELIKGKVHICVHSLKDVPMELPEQVQLSCFLKRDTINDAFLSVKYGTLEDMNKMKMANKMEEGSYQPKGMSQRVINQNVKRDNYEGDHYDNFIPTIGTSSLRRSSQIKYKYKNVAVKNMRGNINTRIAKLCNGQYDAIIIAKCGLERLTTKKGIRNIIGGKNKVTPKNFLINYNNTEINLTSLHIQQINKRTIYPALCQGIIAVSSHKSDKYISDVLKNINDEKAQIMANIERSFLYQIEGNCMMPIGGYAKIVNGEIVFNAVINDIHGREKYHVREVGKVESYNEIAVMAATKMKEKIGTHRFNKIREEAAQYYA
ncbi:porphobilinogen deaminase, putative [Plasmodium knowlesi strain H]|uniref:hydroxymethylbilane synthase n=3 Tax=Plasmodium knowlesi TaxID=5850 RepID=A0A5K1V5I1_PLAKH|nr:porphobilinogen deaminase, putative [Plasmodium knowlesi strain H]OTN66693.1 putative Porphobilinogen deaminase [Plasmodium knowlesi]CAA9990134.1 porphobilinogen deaminase, putative [Plasmodium knowlesi strain H]SBO25819.1 porphobilinogen deaminase, putative [Plasmodium knowlesi strain H]SBO28607.1 porphobilinogen deaminase, putative [Plasmodium knowlesi strain H]VVS79608.1 porphobilinogen deaminase, putative [Plasmodium knowlesi strain H]|eukprot:XP_002260601.1 Porphobilinogen deaminase, putative [Plasmodium knowlesi strain H]